MERPIIKDKNALEYVAFLEKRLDAYEKSPYYKTYTTLHDQIGSFNDQLSLGKKKKIMVDDKEIEIDPGFVDLFADKDDKSFDRTKWYFDNMLSLNKNLDEIRKLMTPEDQKKLAERDRIKSAGLAEKIALGLSIDGK